MEIFEKLRMAGSKCELNGKDFQIVLKLFKSELPGDKTDLSCRPWRSSRSCAWRAPIAS